jgi:hypothetical protein
VRFRARLSQSLSWTLTVTSAGAEVARGTGSGKTLDWTWDATTLPSGSYRWSITAGSARPATGSVRSGVGSGTGTTLAISETVATPGGITPNGDGQGDVAEVSFALSVPANVTVELADAAGTVLATPLDRVWQSAGKHTVTVDGASLADGVYTVTVRARTASSVEVVQAVPLVVSRTLGLVSATPGTFSPNGDGRNDQLEVAFALTVPATVTLRIVRDGRWVAAPVLGTSFAVGEHRVAWDGSRSQGRLRDGTYEAVVEVTDAMGAVSFGVPFTSDTTAPRVRIVRSSKVRLVVSEPATVAVTIGARSFQRQLTRPGAVVFGLPRPGTRVRVVATDAAGNTSSPAVWRRPARKG